MPNGTALALERFLQTLEIVYRKGKHVAYSWGRLYIRTDQRRMDGKARRAPELAERLDALLSRFGGMQDTMGGNCFHRD